MTDLGENRAQELLAKTAVTGPPPVGVRWHFLGRLQRNKVRALAPWVACWQSVDRAELGAEIARRAPGARVLVEVNLGGGAAEGRLPPGAASRAWSTTLRAAGLDVAGLMTVPPARRRPPPLVRRAAGPGWRRSALPELSMGMSDDFEVAVEEGATIVRVGRALFGPRPGHP